ncbi:hypothetical protein DFH09DRAFT_1492687 [Mycena vulgaris]|nr:hypothetical protein DFH09DRAFT_1492687 [Mycena vulgaris]
MLDHSSSVGLSPSPLTSGAPSQTLTSTPWWCEWSQWKGWVHGPEPLQDRLRRRYNIAEALNPIMYHFSSTTVFESRGTFYLFELMERSVAASHGWIVSNVQATEKLPITHSEQGFRLAAAVPYHDSARGPSRLGLLASKARAGLTPHRRLARDPQRPPPRTIHLRMGFLLPTDDRYPTEFDVNTEEELRSCWGVPGLAPVMYIVHTRTTATYWLRKFEGTYSSVEDFMENADWNRLSPPMEELEDWYLRWEEEYYAVR